MAALLARQEGARGASGGVRRPCDPDDIVRAMDRLGPTLTARHVAAMFRWGSVQMPPCPIRDGVDHGLWAEAMGLLDRPLRARGIIA